MSHSDLFQRRERALGPGAPLFYAEPLHIVRGEGAWLFDADGRRYVDMYNNVPCVGHGNPRVAAAVGAQMATLNVHSRYLHDGIVGLAERLTALHGPQIESVIFSCSGTEANEIALRMARFATGRRGILCSNATYHGNSTLVGSLTHLGRSAEAPRDVRAFPFPDLFRPQGCGAPAGANADQVAAACLAMVDEAISSLVASGAGLAALIVCPIFANEGLPRIPDGLMRALASRVRAAGGLVIADEVQSGYGRTGRWWGYQRAGFEPDIVVTGKPMGNGVPLAATAASRDLVATFRARTRYFNTFAASPLQAAAGNAVLDELESRSLIAHADTLGTWLRDALTVRAARWPAIGDVRGAGLFLGLDIVSDEHGTENPTLAAAICNELRNAGFLTAPAGARGNVVKIRPPLPFSRADAEAFLAAFDALVSRHVQSV